MIEIIKAAFAAGEVKTFLIQGEYVEILEAAYPVDVAMMDRSGAQLSTMRNAEASYFSRPGKYEVIQVTSSAAQTVRLFVGSGDAGTRRTSGDVSVIDGEKSRTIGGGSYAGTPSAASDPANYGNVQLWNPAGSGKNLIVTQCGITAILTGSTAVYLFFSAIELITDLTASKASSKKSGGLIGSAKVKTQLRTASETLPNGSLFSLSAKDSLQSNWPLKGPLVVTPGYGLNSSALTLSTQIQANFEWFEEAI